MVSRSPLPGPAAIVLNAAAGTAATDRTRRMVAVVRAGLDADLIRVATRDAAELAALLQERIHAYRTVVVAGGDGTLGVTYNVLAGSPATIGYLPAGFGNATAHLLRLPRQPEAVAAIVLAGDARPVDLVRVRGRLALFAGAGWDAYVAGRYADAGARGTRGWARAIGGAIPDLFRRPTVRLTVDGAVVHEGPMELLVASTTPYFGRGLLVNHGAVADAGRMRLRVYAGPAPHLALEAVRWAAGRRPAAAAFDGTTAELAVLQGPSSGVPLQVDGDQLGTARSWEFAVAPGAVRLIGNWPAR
jgi:diacylglycerol kinase family enzyme